MKVSSSCSSRILTVERTEWSSSSIVTSGDDANFTHTYLYLENAGPPNNR